MSPSHRLMVRSSRPVSSARAEPACVRWSFAGRPGACNIGVATAAASRGPHVTARPRRQSLPSEARGNSHDHSCISHSPARNLRRGSLDPDECRDGANPHPPEVLTGDSCDGRISIRPAVHAPLCHVPAIGTVTRLAADVRAALHLHPLPSALGRAAVCDVASHRARRKP